MDFLLILPVLLFFRTTFASPNQVAWISRTKRSTLQIPECLYVASEESFYYVKTNTDSDEVCGIYLFADPDKRIQISFQYLDVPCENGGLVTVFDGWELNGKFFPGAEDHEKSFYERYDEICGVDMAKKVFLTTQNAGMIHYKVPHKGKGFGFTVRFLPNPAPCNILVENKEGVYTLKNHGKANNCTLMAVFPAKIKVLALDVGAPSPNSVQCGQMKVSDRLLIGGSEGFDSSHFALMKDICGLEQESDMRSFVVGCDVSIVRLVSSGLYDNSATFAVVQPDEVDLMDSDFFC